MYIWSCPLCLTPKTQRPKSFITEDNFNKHMEEMHSITEPIKDFQEELNNLSDEIKALKLSNEHLQSQLNAQSISSVNDLRTIKLIKKKVVKKIDENEINEKMIKDEEGEQKEG